MSFQATSSPVSEFTRSYRIGWLLRESSIRNEMSVLSSPDISDTGMLSRPNDRVPDQMGRAMQRLLRRDAMRAVEYRKARVTRMSNGFHRHLPPSGLASPPVRRPGVAMTVHANQVFTDAEAIDRL